MTDFLGIIAAGVLFVLFVPAMLYLVWRLRRLERRIAELPQVDPSQLDLHLYELIAELEMRGERLKAQLDKREVELAQRVSPSPHPPEVPPGDTPTPNETATAEETPPAAPPIAKPLTLPQHAVSQPTTPTAIASLYRQAADGQTAEEIARGLQVGVGEVELALRLSEWGSASNERSKRSSR